VFTVIGMKSISARGCARGLAVGVLLAGCVVDVLFAGAGAGTSILPTGAAIWPVSAVLLTGMAGVLWPAGRRPARLGPEVRTAVPALISLLYTVAVRVAGSRATFGPAEIMILLSLLFVAVRHCPPRRAVVCAALDAGALLLLPLRAYRNLTGVASGFEMAALILAVLTVGSAAYLRSLDYRRAVAVTETRRSERLAIAADLHDFVAHHVTGILVQAQMARMMATTPQDLDPVLSGIEQAATEALASMRRTVGVLRDTGPEATNRRPVGDLAGIQELTGRFTATGPRAVLHQDAALPEDLPHEIQSAAFRVVQEALTNVRRHAADATEVVVTLTWDSRSLEVTVTDDGRGGTQLPAAAHGSGFGLVGLKERVTALGGHFSTRPRTENGWQVRAVLPATR
jgi:signal transduction histidine kinase